MNSRFYLIHSESNKSWQVLYAQKFVYSQGHPLLLVLGVHTPGRDSSLNPAAKCTAVIQTIGHELSIFIYPEERALVGTGYCKLRGRLATENFAQGCCLVWQISTGFP